VSASGLGFIAVLPRDTASVYGAAWSATGAGVDLRIGDLNWMQVEEYLRRDDRTVLPLGGTEQHSHVRLTADLPFQSRVFILR